MHMLLHRFHANPYYNSLQAVRMIISVPFFQYEQTPSGECGNNYNSNGHASKMSIMSMDCAIWEEKT
jgi:hypothetical protein